MPKEVTRYIKADVQKMLWDKAVGRCEFFVQAKDNEVAGALATLRRGSL